MTANRVEGFQIALDQAKGIVKIRLWGFWDTKLAEEYRKTFQEQIADISANEKEWHLLIDITEYPSQLPEIQHIISEGLALLEHHNIIKRAILVNGAITPLEAKSLGRGGGAYIYSYFRSEEDAVRWLLST